MIANLFETFCHNISFFGDKVIIYKNKSQQILKSLMDNLNHYDYIYIDGDHHASSVLEDAILSFPLLKQDGIMIFDDYNWCYEGGIPGLHIPRAGIDAFLSIYADKIEVITKSDQVTIRKL